MRQLALRPLSSTSASAGRLLTPSERISVLIRPDDRDGPTMAWRTENRLACLNNAESERYESVTRVTAGVSDTLHVGSGPGKLSRSSR
jgi:hypothetical protein